MLKNSKIKGLVCLCTAFFILCGISGCGNTQSQYGSLTSDIDVSQAQGKAADKEFTEAYADFAVKSFINFRDESGEKNSMISPISVMLSLAMTSNGAEGETLSEMENLLTGGMNTEELNKYLYSFSQKLTQGESSLCTANSVWFRDNEDTIQVNEDFLKTAAEYYSAQIFKEPFDGQTADKINGWVRENTGGMIDKMVDVIEADTIMYLINAVAFQGDWENIYYDTEIFNGVFHNQDKTETEREFMYSMEYKYITLGEAEGFIKDYKGGDFSFAVLLPPEGMDINEFIESLQGEQLTEAFKNYKNEAVAAYLPKFSCQYEIQLKEPLMDMGMVKAFDSSMAEFSRLCTSSAGNVYVGSVLHKTFINVDEKGTTAGAASMVEIKNESAVVAKEINLNRPFLYFIIENETGLPVFMGDILTLAE